VEGPEPVARPTPIWFGEAEQEEAITIPSKEVAALSGACLYGPDGNVVTGDDTFLWNTAWHQPTVRGRGFAGRALLRRKKPNARLGLPGRTAGLTSDWSIGGFAHFLVDALPRWRLIRAAGYTPADFRHFALYQPNSETARFLIRAAGIPADRLVAYTPSTDYQCDELVTTSFPGAAPAISPSSIAWLRTLAGTADPRRRVYASRAGYRRHPANAIEIEDELRRRGFEILHGEQGTSALDAFAHARVTVGVEGSNLFNLCFAPPGSRAVLLLPGPHMLQYIPFICQAAGLSLGIVTAIPASPIDAPVFSISAVVSALDWAESVP
jgi:capsular polysaccharide biosynthesis protein